jgi:hypothetical protein
MFLRLVFVSGSLRWITLVLEDLVYQYTIEVV